MQPYRREHSKHNLETLSTFQVFIEIEGMLNKMERCLKLKLMNL